MLGESLKFLSVFKRVYLPEKNTFPPGHEKCSGWVVVQTSLMLPRAEFRTTIWMTQDKVVATTWLMNMVLGGIFM